MHIYEYDIWRPLREASDLDLEPEWSTHRGPATVLCVLPSHCSYTHWHIFIMYAIYLIVGHLLQAQQKNWNVCTSRDLLLHVGEFLLLLLLLLLFLSCRPRLRAWRFFPVCRPVGRRNRRDRQALPPANPPSQSSGSKTRTKRACIRFQQAIHALTCNLRGTHPGRR